MVDLLGLEMNYVRDFPPDGRSADGFFNNGRSLQMSATQLDFYLEAARRGLNRVIVSGSPPQVFRHHFKQSNIGGWRGPTEPSNRLERAQKFLVKIVNDYPETGDFIIRVRTQAKLKPNKGFPLLEVAVGYRPDTEVHFRVAGVREIISEDIQQYEFRGRLENFPLPVRGQGKYPGLVIRLRNIYDDGTAIPNKIEKIQDDGKERKGFRPEPHLPHLLIESIDFEGPAFSEWPPANHQRILFASQQRHADEAAYLEEVFRRFLTRAFRRPPTKSEIVRTTSFYTVIRPDYPSLEEAVRETLAMILIQPEFLYLVEPGGNEKRAVTDWELASRLSYFLWSTMPDDRLLQAATRGLLGESKMLQAEVNRMLADERSQRFITQFVSQWLELERIETIAVDSKLHPDFRASTKQAMAQETTELFSELLRGDDSALKLLKADYTMLNESLARHYGIGGIYGTTFRPVKLLTQQQPGGILGHAVNAGRATEASLGYFMLPLLTIIVGRFVFQETLSTAHRLAIALAVAAVVLQMYAYGSLPWISLVVSTSFALYGAIRKNIVADSMQGLFIETLCMSPFALGWLWFTGGAGMGAHGLRVDVFLLLAGVYTTAPLLTYIAAARLLPLSIVGFTSYLGPTLQLLVAQTALGESIDVVTAGSFGLVWVGVVLVSGQGLLRVRRQSR